MKDINLQEAVRRREEQLPPMPSDLNERLLHHIKATTVPSRHYYIRWIAAVASLILVVGIGFKFLRLPKQTETKIVEAVEREEQPAKLPVVEPRQPVVAKAEEPLQQKPSRRSKPTVRKEKASLSPSLSQEENVATAEPSTPSSEETMEAFVEPPDPYLALEAQVQDIRSRGERFSQEIAQLME
ncbi:MAG: hypothetical protein J6T78_03760 [Bacteroidaceae bacterium]|nr:hypothetical protein [Bacteroidaceae bacterium]